MSVELVDRKPETEKEKKEIVFSEKVDKALEEYLEARDYVPEAIENAKLRYGPEYAREVAKNADENRRRKHNQAVIALREEGFIPRSIKGVSEDELLERARKIVEDFAEIYDLHRKRSKEVLKKAA